MTDDQHKTLPYKLLSLRVTTDADPGILSRILAQFHNLNLTPRRVVAEFGSAAAAGMLFFEIQVCGLPEERLSIITAKVGQFVAVRQAYWHYL
jgi:hypothetical protein